MLNVTEINEILLPPIAEPPALKRGDETTKHVRRALSNAGYHGTIESIRYAEFVEGSLSNARHAVMARDHNTGAYGLYLVEVWQDDGYYKADFIAV